MFCIYWDNDILILSLAVCYLATLVVFATDRLMWVIEACQ